MQPINVRCPCESVMYEQLTQSVWVIASQYI
ncbi:hypothetical protein FHW13_000531 [Dokdonella fugitiva]|jgi:hypothetical protein|nr:hypothetical protein [Dokdonella fugitiva]